MRMTVSACVVLALVVLACTLAQARRSPFALPDPLPVPDEVRARFASEPDVDARPFYISDFADRRDEIRERSRVNLSELPGFEAIEPPPQPIYAGFATVNDEYQSNMFYWFFESQAGADAPVVMWLQGGPGGSSLFGLFCESGPYELTQSLEIVERNETWVKFASMLYVDNPIGTGFSYTENPGGVSYTETQVAENLYAFLLEFFFAYPEYAKNDFYIAGESYGGKYVPATAQFILQKNRELAAMTTSSYNGTTAINLVGVSIGDGLSDPVTQVTGYSDLAYNFGIADRAQADAMAALQSSILNFIGTSQWAEASAAFNELVDGPPDLFQRYSGSPNYFDVRISYNPTYGGDFSTYVNSSVVRAALHVGNHYFQSGEIAAAGLQDDLCKSVKYAMVDVYNSLKVLTYNGQFDFIVGAPLTEIMLEQFGSSWSEWTNWLKAEKIIWRLHPKQRHVAGYVKQVGNFTQVVVRDAGHILPYDVPSVAFAMLYNFIYDVPFKN